tara:strand:- start:994 stop:1365 length:372 start_codon:yes stop_codon:yes gene_type:complete
METFINMAILFSIIAFVISILSFNIGTGVGLAFIITIYMFPAYLARSRGHRNSDSIATFNLFLGWTFICWVAALIWAQNDFDESRKQETPYEMLKPYIRKLNKSKKFKAYKDKAKKALKSFSQ